MEDRLRILAVDDNTINLARIEQELKSKYEVITVNSGVRAIRYLKTEKPDLILLDIQMALKDGIETLKEIRTMENGATIPVIMLTSKQDRESIIESSRLGVSDYVLKPFNGQDLQERIIRTLKRAGVIEVEDSEIYAKIQEIEEEIRAHNHRNAINKIDEILRFKIEEEVSGRLQNARVRLKADDEGTALRLVGRVLKMLERSMHGRGFDKMPLTQKEIFDRLRRILRDLENFKVHDAAEKLEDLQNYNIPPYIQKSCEVVMEHLDEYDDGAAEEVVRRMVSEAR